MPKQMYDLYKELVNTDRELSYEQRNYDDLYDELTELDAEREIGNITIQGFQKDIEILLSRLHNSESVIDNECNELETAHGILPPGNSLPNTLEEILTLNGDAKTKAGEELNRILSEHGVNVENKENPLKYYTDLLDNLASTENELFDDELKYGQLPETEKELYALNESDSKDKKTIDAIMNVLNKSNQDLASSGKKTWEETKKDYEKIKAAYETLREVHAKQSEVTKNIVSVDLNTLRQQQNSSGLASESTDFITQNAKTLINGELEKHKDSLGIGSLEEYFNKENELNASKPDTTVLDDLPGVVHFFTEFNKLSGEKAQKARDVVNALIKAHNGENPPDGAATSIEDYEKAVTQLENWEVTKTEILNKLQGRKLNRIKITSNKELSDNLYYFEDAINAKDSALVGLSEKFPKEYPVKVTQIKELQKNDPIEFLVLSKKIEKLSKDDTKKKILFDLADKPYDGFTLISDHSEMRELEEKNKREILEQKEKDRLKELQERVREIKERLENDKKTNKVKKLSENELAEREQFKAELKKADEDINMYKKSISTLVEKESEKYADEAASKKKHIKEEVIKPKQDEVQKKLNEFKERTKAHEQLTKNVEKHITDLKEYHTSKLKEYAAAINHDEEILIKNNQDDFIKKASTKSMVDLLKAENKARNKNDANQKALNDSKSRNKPQIEQLNKQIKSVRKDTESWIKEDKESRDKKLQTINESVTSKLNDKVNSAKKEAKSAGMEAKVTGFLAQKVGKFTDFYRTKIREVSDGMIKAPRLEKEAEMKELNKKLEDAGIASAFMEIDNVESFSVNKFHSAIDEALANKELNLADLQIHEISKKILQLNEELLTLKETEEKRLQENEIKFNKIFSKTIPTERMQLENASIAKRDSEIEAANGNENKIALANAEYELRKSELDDKFTEEDLKDETFKKEIDKINKVSEKLGKSLNEANLSKIDTVVSIGESIVNFALGKLQGDDSDEGMEPISVNDALDQMKESLTAEPETEHVVNKILEMGEIVYQKLQNVNDSLNEKYQDASREHSLKTNLYKALESDNQRFQTKCANDTENIMGISLKDKRITYLKEEKSKVKEKLNGDINAKNEAKKAIGKKVAKLNDQFTAKEKEVTDSTKKMSDGFSRMESLEKQMDELRDIQLDNYRNNVDKPLTKAVTPIKLKKNKLFSDVDLIGKLTNAELIGQLTNAPLDANASLDDVMERIQKINMNGLGLINFIDTNNEYSEMLSANEADQRAFAEKMLNSAGSTLKEQLGKSIIAVEQDDYLLHPVLLEGNSKYKSHNNSTTLMVADFNAIRLESARLNIKVRETEKVVDNMKTQMTISEKEKQLQKTLNTAVKQSRSRMSLADLMEEEKPSNTRRFFKRSS